MKLGEVWREKEGHWVELADDIFEKVINEVTVNTRDNNEIESFFFIVIVKELNNDMWGIAKFDTAIEDLNIVKSNFPGMFEDMVFKGSKYSEVSGSEIYENYFKVGRANDFATEPRKDGDEGKTYGKAFKLSKTSKKNDKYWKDK